MLTKTYAAATAENVTYTYDNVASGNKGRGRLTRVVDQSGSLDRVYDVRGNITSETRTIGGFAHVVSYTYNTADRITQVTYPSGRQVNYARNSLGRITGVTTKQTSTAATVNVATSITYQPMSNLVKSLTYGNTLTETDTHSLDYEQTRCQVNDGPTKVLELLPTRTDALNITGITDGTAAVRNQSFGYTAANRLSSAAQTGTGGYGTYGWTYDGVGNRTGESRTPVGGVLATDTYAYATTNNRITSITRGASTVRSFTYDNAGNILTDNGFGGNKTYTYNKRNRLDTATVGALSYAYVYNAQEQLAVRTQASPAATTHFIHDYLGNVIAETAGGGATGTSGTVREYIWLPEAEIAPTMDSAAEIGRPLAVFEAVNTVSPILYHVHVDHLNRPAKMTNTAKAVVWEAVWQPFGGVQGVTGVASLNARFPGQWFQAETGLHYNWHRFYDPSLGRFTQPDPLGFVDGPGVYVYANGSILQVVDPDGLLSSQDVTDLLGCYASATSFGVTDYVLRGKYNRCSDACKAGRYLAIFAGGVGAARIAYAGAAKSISLAAGSSEAGARWAISQRNNLKKVFRLNPRSTFRIYDPDEILKKYPSPGAAAAAAGRTNRTLNIIGGVLAGGLSALFDEPTECCGVR